MLFHTIREKTTPVFLGSWSGREAKFITIYLERPNGLRVMASVCRDYEEAEIKLVKNTGMYLACLDRAMLKNTTEDAVADAIRHLVSKGKDIIRSRGLAPAKQERRHIY